MGSPKSNSSAETARGRHIGRPVVADFSPAIRRKPLDRHAGYAINYVRGGRVLSEGRPMWMRRVEIVEEPNQTYKWIAIDRGTRQSLLRLADLHQLRDVCHRLGWTVVDVKRTSQSGFQLRVLAGGRA